MTEMDIKTIAIICGSIVLIFLMGFVYSYKVEVEKEITNRELGTNRVYFKRWD